MQRLAKSAGLGAILAVGFALTAAAQMPQPAYQNAPPPPYATQDQNAGFPYSGSSAPAQIAPEQIVPAPPVDPWHELNNERMRLEQRLNVGGG
jgi:hypothetical protein